MTRDAEFETRLTDWLRTQLPDVDDVRTEGLDRVSFGHSAEMMMLDVVTRYGNEETRQPVVVRLRPEPPALLEPYDLSRQFRILRALRDTPVRVPDALWLEQTGEVLGQPFFVMERAAGDVYEMQAPADVDDDTVARMCQSLAEQIAAIHSVDLAQTGLDTLDDGSDHLDRELEHWTAEMNRVKRGSLPALERLHRALQRSRPQPCPSITLVHGDAKPGNFAFAGGEVSAVFDWEMTTVGDPLTDIGWLEMLWMQPVGINSHPAALPIEALLAHYEATSGITVQNRAWYRAFNAYKMAVICLIGAMLVEDGHSDDQKLVLAAFGTAMLTKAGLSDLGIDEPLDDGPVLPREERVQQILAQAP
ncbi:MAG: phosphotransferase family protein [Mycobacterium sp.]|uniref:phosphotransferase family protein n=1 Tax=Mycobacterium sp. TaxID=1785 RepID=UPI001EB8F534|nr:phosphotransferase family protein [Mycobacterium sp.]MBV8790400.1 phosphotransferase family protein [Mycobacterium sp.]